MAEAQNKIATQQGSHQFADMRFAAPWRLTSGDKLIKKHQLLSLAVFDIEKDIKPQK
ncbi:MAG: hypothetical protein ACK4P4_08445 [Allorhizobium sp.]